MILDIAKTYFSLIFLGLWYDSRLEQRVLTLGITELEYTSQVLELAGAKWEESGFADSGDDEAEHDHKHE